MKRILISYLLASVFGLIPSGSAKTADANLANQIAEQLATGSGRVELRDRGFSESDLKLLLGLPSLDKATELDLSGNPLREDGAEVLARSSSIKGLRVLRLGRCKLGYVGAKALSALLELPELRELHLESNDLGDTGAAAMAYSDKLGQLEVLNLRQNGISDQGAKRFLEPNSLGARTRLELGGNDKISEPVRAALRERYGDRVSFEAGSP